MRVKLWSRDGTILYSDEPAAGSAGASGSAPRRWRCSATAAPTRRSATWPSPRTASSARTASCWRRTRPIRTPDGTPLLFEIYQRFSSVSASARAAAAACSRSRCSARPARAAADPAAARASLARRLQRGHERARAAAGQRDRGRRARAPPDRADLHDGVVQDLAGVAFGLAPLAEDAARRGAGAEAGALRDAIAPAARRRARAAHAARRASTRRACESTGLQAALHDLLSPLEADGIATELRVSTTASARRGGRARLPRRPRGAAQRRRRTPRASPTCGCVPSRTRLVVADDGRGFAPTTSASAAARTATSGSRCSRRLVARGRRPLDVRSRPGAGHDGRAGGAATDDPRAARRRPRRDPGRARAADRRARRTSSWSASPPTARRRSSSRARARARRRADGPRRCPARRHRGDAADPRRPPRDRACSC